MALSTRSTPRRTVSATRARQGRMGRHVIWVLLFGTLLALLGLFAAWAWRSDDLASTEPNNARQAADAAVFQSQPSAPLNTPGGDQTSGGAPMAPR